MFSAKTEYRVEMLVDIAGKRYIRREGMAEGRLIYFGEFAVEAGGERITRFDTQRAAKLIALVGLSRSKRLSRTELADLLWPDDFPDATRLRLRQELARARKALGSQADLLIADGDFVGLAEVSTDRDDLINLSRLPADAPAYVRLGEHFDSVFGGEFLATWEEPWVYAERQQAHEIRREVGLKAGMQALLQGRSAEVLAICAPLAVQNPLDEPLRMLLVQAYAASGSMTQAMSEFQQLKRALREENRSIAEESESVMADLGNRPVIRTPEPSSGSWRPLPATLVRTFGRTEERQAIAQLWADGARLVTLLGPGGIGKTHLALDAARDAEAQGGQVGWVPLAELGTVDRFPSALLYQANLFAPDNVDELDFFIRSVGVSPVTLVLDNVEHLMPDLAARVRRLLEGLPELRILATSRVPLSLSGEQQMRVGPLDPATAGRELLLDLWRGLRPNLATNSEIEAELTELVERLDGYPLALRLIAPRLKLRSPGMVLRDLGEAPIAAKADDLPERHRDLSALISASVMALPSERRETLLALTMFPAGALVDQLLDAVTSASALDDIDALVDQSLVILDEDAHVRLRTLGLVKSAVRSVADPEAQRAAREGFVRAMLASVRRALPSPWMPISAEQLDRFDEEVANVHEAVRAGGEVAASIQSTWWRHDVARGRYLYLSKVIPPLLDSANAQDRPHLELAFGIANGALGRDQEFADWLERAIAGYASLGDRGGEATAMARLASLERRTRSIEVALERGQQAVELAHQSGHKHIAAECELTYGVLCIFANESARAAEHIRRAVDLSQESGDHTTTVNAGLRYMSVLHGLADFAGMLAEADRLLPMAESLREPGAVCFAHELRGRAYIGLEQYDEAESSFRESYRGWQQLGNTFQMADQTLSLSRTFVERGMGKEAETWLQQSSRLWMEADDPGGLNAALTILARCWMMRGETEQAARVLGYQAALAKTLELRLVDSEISHRDEWRAKVGKMAEPAAPATAEGALALFYELPLAPSNINSQIKP